MHNDRYIISLIENIISEKLYEPSQSDPKTIMKADNGEFMDLTVINTSNVKLCVATWSTSEGTVKTIKGLLDPFPVVAAP